MLRSWSAAIGLRNVTYRGGRSIQPPCGRSQTDASMAGVAASTFTVVAARRAEPIGWGESSEWSAPIDWGASIGWGESIGWGVPIECGASIDWGAPLAWGALIGCEASVTWGAP